MMHGIGYKESIKGRKGAEARPGLPASDNADLINGV